MQSAANTSIVSGPGANNRIEACMRPFRYFPSILPELTSAPFLLAFGDLVSDRDSLFEDDARDDENNGMLMSATRMTKIAMRVDEVKFLRR